MTTQRWYKTVRLDGGSMHDPDFRYEAGKTVRRRNTGVPQLCTDTVLHASPTPPLAATYAPRWPYRLIEVAGKPVVQDEDKAGFRQLTVIGERDVAECFAPCGAKVVALLRRCETLTDVEATAMVAARVAAQGAAWDATRDAAWAAARVAAWAAGAYAMEDLIGHHRYTQQHHDLLVAPWESVVGEWDGAGWLQ